MTAAKRPCEGPAERWEWLLVSLEGLARMDGARSMLEGGLRMNLPDIENRVLQAIFRDTTPAGLAGAIAAGQLPSAEQGVSPGAQAPRRPRCCRRRLSLNGCGAMANARYGAIR